MKNTSNKVSTNIKKGQNFFPNPNFFHDFFFVVVDQIEKLNSICSPAAKICHKSCTAKHINNFHTYNIYGMMFYFFYLKCFFVKR